ncbi:PAS domain S-box protein [Methanoregula sp.]|uniref:PAS domain S-box protein n=1 Tax=Methanoregula sp. TaxID=2052170 RepID=UPI003C78AFB3
MVSRADEVTTESPGGEGTSPEKRLLIRVSFFSGILASVSAILGIVQILFGITLFSSLFSGNKTIAFSAAVAWIFFGGVLAIHAIRPLESIVRACIALLTAVIAVAAAFEFPLNILGKHFIVETLFIRLGNALTGQPTTPISPVAAGLIIPAAIALFLLFAIPRGSRWYKRFQDIISITGIFIALVSFTFVLSYLYGSPFLYETPIIPIAFMSALAGVFTGIGLVASAGPSAIPCVYFIGGNTRARLLRAFIPLTLIIFFIQIVLQSPFFAVPDAIQVALILVVFALLTIYVVARVSSHIGSSIDIAEQKRQDAEEELRQNYGQLAASQEQLRGSEERYRSLFENMLEGYAFCRMLYDDDGLPADFIYLNVNRSFDRIIGTKTVTGKRVTEVFPGIREAFPQIFETYGRVALTGQPEAFDLDFSPAGRWLHISVYSTEKEYFVAIFEDITARRQAEERITASEVRYRRLFESAKDGILILDRDTGEIMDSNPFIGTLTGYSKEELLGRHLWDIGFIRDQILSKIAFEDLQKNEYIRYEDLPLETKDGQKIEVEFVSNIYPINNMPVIQCNIRDITERKRVENLREELIKELEQKNSELERFTYTVSHDLKSPLITIKGFLGVLEEDVLNGDNLQLKSDIARISGATEKMETLLGDLLTLSRIGRIANPSENVSFETLAREAVEQVAGGIRDKGIAVTIQPDLPLVYVDRVRILEVLVNLIENSIKFMGDQKHPAIQIGVRNGPQPAFFVQDNGIGIEPQYDKKIFGLFEKLNAQTEGTGIGLALVKRIIEFHGGKIWVESAGLGAGSTFWFTLPAATWTGPAGNN